MRMKDRDTPSMTKRNKTQLLKQCIKENWTEGAIAMIEQGANFEAYDYTALDHAIHKNNKVVIDAILSKKRKNAIPMYITVQVAYDENHELLRKLLKCGAVPPRERRSYRGDIIPFPPEAKTIISRFNKLKKYNTTNES